jgi:allantoin racemase
VRLLLFNPNRSAHITERLAASARGALHAGDTLQAVTGTAGPRVVHDAATLLQAEQEAQRALPAWMAEADALLLGVSLDGAIEALRAQFAPKPAVGMTEAAVVTAALLGRRVGLLTLGPTLLPLYRARLEALLPAERIAGLEAPDLPQAFAPGAPGVLPELLPDLVAAARRLVLAGADGIVLAGAVLCGYERAIQAQIGRPVLDGVACAVHQLHALRAATGAPT